MAIAHYSPARSATSNLMSIANGYHDQRNTVIVQKTMHFLFFGNTVESYAISVGMFFGLVLVIGIVKHFVLARLRESARKAGTVFTHLLVKEFEKNAVPFFIIIAFYFATQDLKLGGSLNKIIHVAVIIVPTFLIVRFMLSLVTFGLERQWKRADLTGKGRQSFRILQTLIQVFIWVIAGIVLFDNLGVKISTLVAGLGIGGIAIALASQAVLGDVFAFIMILFDRPFEVGDYIIVNDYMGTVEYIGIKSTRIRSLDGELLVFHNLDLTNARIRNYKKMEERRVLFPLEISYETRLPEMEKIPGLIETIIRSIPDTRFDRAHFKAFGKSSLEYEVVYYVLTPDFNKYMDILQMINFRIRKDFDAMDIHFAHNPSA